MWGGFQIHSNDKIENNKTITKRNNTYILKVQNKKQYFQQENPIRLFNKKQTLKKLQAESKHKQKHIVLIKLKRQSPYKKKTESTLLPTDLKKVIALREYYYKEL